MSSVILYVRKKYPVSGIRTLVDRLSIFPGLWSVPQWTLPSATSASAVHCDHSVAAKLARLCASHRGYVHSLKAILLHSLCFLLCFAHCSQS